MVKYIKGKEREQLVLFPTSIEDMIDENNEIRVIDAFVDSLNIKKIGIKKAEPKMTGRPSYDPKDMLKIYLYGYRNKVRSSRKLMNLCKTNIEMMWLVKQIAPDFRSISDFRKDNGKVLKEVFLEFNIICKDLEILDIKEVSQDGTKIRAVNAKDKNYTLNKIDDRIERLKEKIENYLEEMEENDKKEKSEKLVKVEEIETNKKAYEKYKKEKEEKIKELRAKKELYESYKKEMEEAGTNQKSLTDPESKLMKNNGGFNVCYNMQTIVTTDNHLIANYEITNNPADFGSMSSIVEEAEEKIGERIERNITDNGYSDRKDMIKCLENGTIPEVTPVRGRDGFTLETVYEENEISEKERKSKDKEDIKKCLRAGEIPEIYKDKIESIEVKEEKIRVYENTEEVEELEEEQMRDKAMEEGIFIRDIKGNKVYCPGGCILRQKSKHENGIKYCNKLGCKNCKIRVQYQNIKK